jgi:hypothetical protein
MDLKGAVVVAKQQIEDSFATDAPRDVRLEGFLSDDHLMVWSLTIGFDRSISAGQDHCYKVVRVSESNKTVLSIRDP